MTDASYRFVPWTPEYDSGTFDCGNPAYDEWLVRSAPVADAAGTARTHLLIEERPDETPRIIGYFATSPTGVAPATLPNRARAGNLDPIPGYLLARLALDRGYQGDPERKWGTQLVLGALRRITEAAAIGGGRVIVVDADNEDLVPFYRAHDFLPTGHAPLRLYMKVATARKLLDDLATA